MKLKLFIMILTVLSYNIAFSQMRSTVVIDTPTAYTIGRGTYQFSFLGYDNGGIELKTIIGLHDNLYLGASFNIKNAIGKDKPMATIPGVIIKAKLFDGWETLPLSIAIGYDSFYMGKSKGYSAINKYLGIMYPPYYMYRYLRIKYKGEYKENNVIYGPYLAFTSPIYLFSSEQYISYGVKLPVQPDFLPNDASYFIALDIPIGEYLRLKGEVNRVYWNLRNNNDWFYNFGARYTYLDRLSLEFDILYNPGEKLNRIIRIEYHNEF